MRVAVQQAGGVEPRIAQPATPFAQDHEPRDCSRPGYHAAARLDACRTTAGGIPVKPVAALRGTRAIADTIPVAHVASGNRQLSWPETGNHQPHFFAASTTRHDTHSHQVYRDSRPGGLAGLP